jgi:phosphoribosyl 1,2-cyclic phosphodiesterase
VEANMKKLNFLGIGGATNIELGGNCCYLKDGDNLLVIDMCEGATERLEKEDAFKGVKNIYIAITHTHFDHIAGLGVFVWYCNFNLNISPKIIFSDFKYKHHIKKLLKLTGVDKKYVEFIKDSSFIINDLTLNMQPTTHTPKLQCFGIMFEDKDGKYYYTGDTNDIDYIRKICEDNSVKKVYTEVATETYDVHIKYDDIVNFTVLEKCFLFIKKYIDSLNSKKTKIFEVLEKTMV